MGLGFAVSWGFVVSWGCQKGRPLQRAGALLRAGTLQGGVWNLQLVLKCTGRSRVPLIMMKNLSFLLFLNSKKIQRYGGEQLDAHTL